MKNDAEFYFKQSEKKFADKDIDGGFADIDEAIRLSPDNRYYYWIRGELRYKQIEWKKDVLPDVYQKNMHKFLTLAINDFTKVIELSISLVDQAEAYRKRLFCYRWLGEKRNLIDDATWLIEHGFGDGRVYEWRGLFRSQINELENAIKDYDKAVEVLSDYDTRFGRAMTYRRAKMYREAIDDFTYILNYSKPDHHYKSKVYFERAWAYCLLQNFDKAFQDFEQVVSPATQEGFQNWLKMMKHSDEIADNTNE